MNPGMSRREFNCSLMAAIAAAGRILQGLPQLRIDSKRLLEHLHTLSQCGSNPHGGVSRVAYSEADRQGREYVLGLMRAAGLDASVDVAGNLVGRRPGRAPRIPPLVMGSHIDSVPEGGNYDGALGSLAAIEVAQVLAQKNRAMRHPLEVIVFQNEEGGQSGSRALIGALAEKDLDATTASGRTVRDGIRYLGGEPDKLASARREQGSIASYLELHIEQGGILEGKKIQIGVVEGIVGIRRITATIEGFANHAGTTPMHLRQDALLAAARLIEAVHSVVISVPGSQVGTVGTINALPGAANVIPGRVTLTIELRDLDRMKIELLDTKIVEEARRIERETGTRIAFDHTYDNAPVLTDPKIQALMQEASAELGLTVMRMPSGAGHDAQGMARLGPMGMIFVPSVGGISHSPKEHTKPEDVANGADLLLHTLLKLDEALSTGGRP
jgi:N-carbamoyl-L-amino-acid hydrolase